MNVKLWFYKFEQLFHKSRNSSWHFYVHVHILKFDIADDRKKEEQTTAFVAKGGGHLFGALFDFKKHALNDGTVSRTAARNTVSIPAR